MRDLVVTEDGFESQLQINYLGGCLLLIGLLPLLVETAKLARQNNEPKSKIIFTNSCAHSMFSFDLDQVDYVTNRFRFDFSTHKMYPNSKMFQLMFNVQYFNRIIKKEGLNSIICLHLIHPGVMDTGLFDSAFIKQKLSFVFKAVALFMRVSRV